MTFLLDTNVVSELRKPGADSRVVAWAGRLPLRDTFLSVITIRELEAGVLLVERRDRRRGIGRSLDHWECWRATNLFAKGAPFRGRSLRVGIYEDDALLSLSEVGRQIERNLTFAHPTLLMSNNENH